MNDNLATEFRRVHGLEMDATRARHAYDNAANEHAEAIGTPQETPLRKKAQELELKMMEAEFEFEEAQRRLHEKVERQTAEEQARLMEQLGAGAQADWGDDDEWA